MFIKFSIRPALVLASCRKVDTLLSFPMQYRFEIFRFPFEHTRMHSFEIILDQGLEISVT
jgi:hypothetical protein